MTNCKSSVSKLSVLPQAPLQSHRLPYRGYWPNLQLPCDHLYILHHLHHHHRLLHDEHIRRFRHCDISGAGRARVQKLWAGQEPGRLMIISLQQQKALKSWTLITSPYFSVCVYSVSVWNMPWKPVPCAGTSPRTSISTRCGTWWTPPTLSTWCSPSSFSTPSAWPCRSVCSVTELIYILKYTNLIFLINLCVCSIMANRSPSAKLWISSICCSPASSLWKWSSNSSPSNPGYAMHVYYMSWFSFQIILLWHLYTEVFKMKLYVII